MQLNQLKTLKVKQVLQNTVYVALCWKSNPTADKVLLGLTELAQNTAIPLHSHELQWHVS